MKITKKIPSSFIYLSFLSFGINFCFAFHLANLTGILKLAGASNDFLPLMWLIPPVTGLIIQPIIGILSDYSQCKLGKRKPFILTWGSLGALSFIFLAFANSLWQILFLILMIDCSLNSTAEAVRALTGDSSQVEKTLTRAFALQAIFSGIGGTFGAGLPFIMEMFCHYFSIYPHIQSALPFNLKLAFYSAGVIFFIIVSISGLRIKDSPSTLKNSSKNHFRTIFVNLGKSIFDTNSQFRFISLTHSLSWMGVFIFWLYFSLGLAQANGLPMNNNLIQTLIETNIMRNALNHTAFYFSFYQNISIIYAVFLILFAKYFNIEKLHASSLLIGGSGIILMAFTNLKWLTTLCFMGVGIMWASLIILPYVIILKAASSTQKIGTTMGLFNISITLPQIIAGLVIGPIYKYLFAYNARNILILSALLFICSAFLWFRNSAITKLSLSHIEASEFSN